MKSEGLCFKPRPISSRNRILQTRQDSIDLEPSCPLWPAPCITAQSALYDERCGYGLMDSVFLHKTWPLPSCHPWRTGGDAKLGRFATVSHYWEGQGVRLPQTPKLIFHAQTTAVTQTSGSKRCAQNRWGLNGLSSERAQP